MEDFTMQELSVLRLAAKGLKNREIATELDISIIQTKVCIESVYRKLNVKNRVQAVVKAIMCNLIEV